MTQEVFLNEMLVLVRKKAKVEIIVDEGWHSASEMKQDLRWTQ